MLTPEQEKWINHLPDDNAVGIRCYDPHAREIFCRLEKRIRFEIGENIRIELRGSTKLGISGQGELDIYIPVPPDSFDRMLGRMENTLGAPGSIYSLRRARFVVYSEGTKAEIFLINDKSDDWTRCLKFEGYLETHPEALAAYEKMKLGGNGLSTREYYRRKNEFINEILAKIDSLVERLY